MRRGRQTGTGASARSREVRRHDTKEARNGGLRRKGSTRWVSDFAILIGVAAVGVMALGAQTGAANSEGRTKGDARAAFNAVAGAGVQATGQQQRRSPGRSRSWDCHSASR